MLGYNKLHTKNIRGRMISSAVVALWLSLSVVTPANAAFFYTGDIHIESLSATIDITSKAEVTVAYELVNHGSSAETVNLTVLPSEASALIDGVEILNPTSFDPEQQRELTLFYSIELTPSEFQRITFSSMLFFNDMANSYQIDNYDVQMILPEGITRIVSSNKPFDSSSIQESRLVINWQEENIYPSALSVSWTTLDVDITAVKEANPDEITAAGEIVEVQITIQNQGDQEVTNLQLIDSFFPGAFEAVEPLYEFELVESEMSDPHLYWEKKIDTLGAGDTRNFSYSVKVKTLGLETRLDALSILVNGIPVSVSNDIILYSDIQGIYEPETTTDKLPTTYIIIIAAVAVVVVAGILALSMRKRKT